MKTEDDRDDAKEQGFIAGQQSVYESLLSQCISHLPASTAELSSWRAERVAAIRLLREICAEYGDNDWPDDLHLEDILEKHLLRHLKVSISQSR